jgi:hypothetical protein
MMAVVAPSKPISSTGYECGVAVRVETIGWWQTRCRMGGFTMNHRIGILRLWEPVSTVVLVNNRVVVFATTLGRVIPFGEAGLGVIPFRGAQFFLLEIFETRLLSMNFNNFRKLRNVQATSVPKLYCP